ncbi:MAG: hypothetical protein ACK5LC_12945 [Coprobacillaceae bacterium]
MLTKKQVITIAKEYHTNAYRKNILRYEITNIQFLEGSNYYHTSSVWEVTFDVESWDDIWYAIVIDNHNGDIICCSNAWNSKYEAEK